MCSNVAALRQIDILEPASTICTLIVGVPTFANAIYVYTRLLQDKRFSTNLYFRLFITMGFVDIISFIANLFRFRLALLPPFNYFHSGIRETVWASMICVFHNYCPRTQLMGQIILTINRLLAVRTPVFYIRNEQYFVVAGLSLIFGIPFICTIPDILMGYRFVPIPNMSNITIFCSGGWPGPFQTFGFATLTTYQFVATGIALVFNLLLFETLVAFNSNKTTTTVVNVGGKAKSRDTSLEQGLIATTIACFAGHFTYSFLQVSYIYIQAIIPEFKYANRGTTITLDIISIFNVWILLLFSRVVRTTVYSNLFPPAGAKPMSTSNQTGSSNKGTTVTITKSPVSISAVEVSSGNK